MHQAQVWPFRRGRLLRRDLVVFGQWLDRIRPTGRSAQGTRVVGYRSISARRCGHAVCSREPLTRQSTASAVRAGRVLVTKEGRTQRRAQSRLEHKDQATCATQPKEQPWDLAKRVAELLTTATLAEVRAHYEIGAQILRIRDEAGVGERAGLLARLAAKIGRSPKFLYQCALVRASFSRGELEAWLERRTAHGESLRWSHFVVMVGLRGRARSEVLDSWFTRSRSVRELQRLVRAARKRHLLGRHPELVSEPI